MSRPCWKSSVYTSDMSFSRAAAQIRASPKDKQWRGMASTARRVIETVKGNT